MKFLSIDCGIKTLSYIVFEYFPKKDDSLNIGNRNKYNYRIIEWEICDLFPNQKVSKKNYPEIIAKLISKISIEFNDIFLGDISKIYIESQPRINQKMRRVETALLTFFIIHKKCVKIISNKFSSVNMVANNCSAL